MLFIFKNALFATRHHTAYIGKPLELRFVKNLPHNDISDEHLDHIWIFTPKHHENFTDNLPKQN